MSEHFIEKCKCGIVVNQCRCAERLGETKTVRIVKCQHPDPPVTDAYRESNDDWMNAPMGPIERNPTLGTLSREQVERECQWLVEEQRGSAAKKWLDTDAALRAMITQRDEQIEKLAAFIIAQVPGEPSKSEGAVDTAIRIITQQAQEIEYERDKIASMRNSFPVDAVSWRGVDEHDVCAECDGAGTKLYGNTSTYQYGAGGQSMTLSVCDKCWGSGNKHKPWRSWKIVEQQAQELAESERKLREVCMAHGPALIEIHDLKQQLAASQARCLELETPRLVLADSVVVEYLETEVEQLWPMLGVESAFVTDLSHVGDFPDEQLGAEKYIWQAAIDLLRKQNAQLQATLTAREERIAKLEQYASGGAGT